MIYDSQGDIIEMNDVEIIEEDALELEEIGSPVALAEAKELRALAARLSAAGIEYLPTPSD